MRSVLGLTTYRWNNNIKSILLLAAFPLLLLTLLGGTYLIFGLIYLGRPGMDDAVVFQVFHLTTITGRYGPIDFAESALFQYWPIVTGIAVVWVLIGYLFNDAIIHAATGAKPVTRQDQPQLYNILENLCISRGMKTPNLYIIDVPEMNAYASGIDEKSFAITVTRGILERLNDKEMEAVLAHELTHIINRDCRLLIVTIVFTGMLSFVAQMMWRGARFSLYTRDSEGNNKPSSIVLMLIPAAMLFIGYLLALVLRFALSRKREYLADAGSVELTKDPEALISALRKISDAPEIPHVPPEVKQLFFEDPPSALDLWGLFNTHPAISDRIHVLEELGGLPPEGQSIIPKSGG